MIGLYFADQPQSSGKCTTDKSKVSVPTLTSHRCTFSASPCDVLSLEHCTSIRCLFQDMGCPLVIQQRGIKRRLERQKLFLHLTISDFRKAGQKFVPVQIRAVTRSRLLCLQTFSASETRARKNSMLKKSRGYIVPVLLFGFYTLVHKLGGQFEITNILIKSCHRRLSLQCNFTRQL